MRLMMSGIISFAQFIREAFPIACPNATYKHNWHISALSAEYERLIFGKTDRMIVNMPPGAMNTLFGVFFSAWAWAVDPTRRGVNISGSDLESFYKGGLFTTIVESNWYQRKFADVKCVESLNGLRNTKGGWMSFISVGGVLLAQHPHFMIIDSIHKPTDVLSSKNIEKTIRWFVSAFERQGIINRASVVITMPRLAINDLCGVILGESPSPSGNAMSVVKWGNWRHVCLPMRYEQSHRYRYEYDMRSIEGELLWPDRMTEDAVNKIQKMMELDKDQSNVRFQLQQNPLVHCRISENVSSNSTRKYLVELSGCRSFSETVEANSETEAIRKVAHKLKEVRELTTVKASSID